jgi:hypothetical protein
MADAADSKSVARKGVWVRLPPPAYIHAYVCISLNSNPVANAFRNQIF